MADEREGARTPGKSPADRNTVQSAGRKANAAQPANAAHDHGGPERYPAVNQTDGVERTGRPGQAPGERRSFDPGAARPHDAEEVDDASPHGESYIGPSGDPAEGKP